MVFWRSACVLQTHFEHNPREQQLKKWLLRPDNPTDLILWNHIFCLLAVHFVTSILYHT